jgi:D-alanine-D-alanine ligase
MFGGRSVEHEVSVITAHQIMENLDSSKFEISPVYVSKEGEWFYSPELFDIELYKDLSRVRRKGRPVTLSPSPKRELWEIRRSLASFMRVRRHKLDVVIPAFHGSYGEDGCVQGILELADIPYVGAGVSGSAVGMDKVLMKDIFRAHDIPTAKFLAVPRLEWEKGSLACIRRIEESLVYPLYVKPANLGSSIAITKANDRDLLKFAIDVASQYDDKVIVEEAIEGAIDVNCSVIGVGELLTSPCEHPLHEGDIYSFDEKYLSKSKAVGMQSARRIVPADIPAELTEQVQRLSKKIFRVTECRGIARVDFLVKRPGNTILANEINTLPGSFSHYLWEKAGLTFGELLEKLIDMALVTHKDKSRNIRVYDRNLLARAPATSAKVKGV